MTVNDSTAERYAQLDPDVRLMLRVRDGDADAFEQLVTRYQNRLLTVLQIWLGSRDQAEDLVQEVFLRVYRARDRYVPASKFSTWLYTIANNVASNARRKLARRREVHLQPADSRELPQASLEQLAKETSGLLPTRLADKAELAQIVHMAINTLNDRQRMAVLLCKFEDLSYAEIAETMNMSPQAIKSLLSRARGNLKSALEPYLHGGRKPKRVNE